MVKNLALSFAIIALLLGYSRASCAQKVIKPTSSIIHIPVADVKLPTTVLISKYIISKIVAQQNKEQIYVAGLDTIVYKLYERENRAIYYFGPGRNDHAASAYKLVYRLADNILCISDLRNVKAETTLYNSVFKEGASGGCAKDKAILTRIRTLVKGNNAIVDSGFF